MKYKSVNELDTFSFRDCRICTFKISDNQILVEAEALIVKPENSQNTNFTESYAGPARLSFSNGKIISAVKDGYKYYNADDVLMEEVPDVKLSEGQIKELLEKIQGAYLYEATRQKEGYLLAVEFVDESDFHTASDSYTMMVRADDIIIEWDFYMNRVQN